VRKSISSLPQEALEKGVIDIVAEDMEDLLAQLDGRKIKKGGATSPEDHGSQCREESMGSGSGCWRPCRIPTSPISSCHRAGGHLLRAVESRRHPAGVIGAISLILAFFAFQSLP
jgi:membrane-bound serine protease (ClpP class)